ncbi:alpha/beta hydrolase [Halioxenophilus sp. WMMB6]|uniref:alpha/beta hydrolase n=1 Tax=Halioxenophilus sp. WMMB6 TaxID=3073815 RepID=UPI00295E8AD0|nr:alpha/beta hydrolase-fold protein [Halioxenophilus sp. WMMB6]
MGRLSSNKLWLGLLALVIAWPAMSEPDAAAQWSQVSLERHTLTAKPVSRSLRLQVALPAGYDPNQRYPVLYYTDAFSQAGRVSEIVYSLGAVGVIPAMISVGIDSDSNTGAEATEARAYLLTPTQADTYQAPFGVQKGWTGGGALFLESLAKEVIPFIESHYAASGERTLYGHSFGGLFAAYTLFSQPQLFSRYLISSPSLAWDNRLILQLESQYAANHKQLPVRVFLSVGSEENIPVSPMVDDVQRLSEVLNQRDYREFQFTSRIFAGEDHFTVTSQSISIGLRALFAAEQAH